MYLKCALEKAIYSIVICINYTGGQTRSENATRGATICECGPSLENIRVSSASVDVHLGVM